MQYVQYGKTDMKVSRLGLGGMRFPEDRQETIDIIRYAIDHGINYVDTAYVYVSSEELYGEALKGGYRDKVFIATKSPSWIIESTKDYEAFLDEELRRLGTDYVDVYLLHNQFPRHWQKSLKFDAFGFLDKMVQKGKIRYKGFSLHDNRPAFEEIVKAYDWDMAQLQINILDTETQVGLDGFKWGAQQGLAMVAMEPLRGGFIVHDKPAAVDQIIADYPEKRSLVEWCMRWLYDMPEVTCVLSGPKTLEQLKGNLHIFDAAESSCMSATDQELIARIVQAYEDQNVVACSACGYCLPCPNGVDIPQVFKLYNDYTRHGKSINEGQFYRERLMPDGRAGDQCTACGHCVPLCTQGLDIPALIAAAHEDMGTRHVDRDVVRVDLSRPA
ncbi:MAG: aldo/keto reductase [Coriobacteriales bacterium]|jgi:predicted aldo/keto reductase-like oxidoreductase|nr:aldo/keto reductase [Coriobacteriales bacterium]